MKNVRLLFILYDRPDYPAGPIINYTRMLPALVQRGYEVHVLVLYWSDFPNAREIQKKSVNIHVSPFIKDSKYAVKWIMEQVEGIQPDIFIPDVSTPGCFAGKWIEKSGIPVINSHRSDDENNWGKAIYFSDPKNGFATSAIFCVNNYLLDQLNKKIKNPELITTVIPSGVPIPDKFSQQKNTLSIVYVGRIIQKQKKIIETAHVFIELAKRFTEINFTFLGNGPDRKNCEEIVANSGYESRFTFTGMLKDDAYKNELAKHDIVILLSAYEGTPGSLMDSMASGLIPICYQYPGSEELVIDGRTGFLVKDRVDSVIEAVSILVTNTGLRKKLSRNARQHIVDRFSIESTLDKWEVLINSLLKQYDGRKIFFTVPKEIELPPMNDLLIEHRIIETPSLFKQILSKVKLRTRIRSILPKFSKRTREISSDNFIAIPFSPTNLDLYMARTSIKNALDRALPRLTGCLLDAGCGKMPYKDYILEKGFVKEYVGLDVETALAYDEKVKPDYTWDGKIMPFENDSFDSCIATEVLEHCLEPEVFLCEVNRVLKSGGTVFFTVPFLWNLHEVPNDQYRYTPFSLERHLNGSGFHDIQIMATGGWHASMAQMMGLWVRRAPISEGKRFLLSLLFKPIIKYLLKRDKVLDYSFSEGQMITGLYGFAKK